MSRLSCAERVTDRFVCCIVSVSFLLSLLSSSCPHVCCHHPPLLPVNCHSLLSSIFHLSLKSHYLSTSALIFPIPCSIGVPYPHPPPPPPPLPPPLLAVSRLHSPVSYQVPVKLLSVSISSFSSLQAKTKDNFHY